MNKKEMLKMAIDDIKKSLARIEKNMDKLNDNKTIQVIKELDNFDVILRKFWMF